MSAVQRRAERDAVRRARAHQREMKRWQAEMARVDAEHRKAAEEAAAHAEVAAFEAHLEELTSVHREAHPTVDWRAIANTPAPSQPQLDRAASALKHAQLVNFRPGLLERTLGIGNGRAALERELRVIVAEEDRRHAIALQHWSEQHASWTAWCTLAGRVLAQERQAYLEVVEGTECLAELATTLGAGLRFHVWSDSAMVELYMPEDYVVPAEEKKLGARAKVTTKKMAASRRMDVFQDFVCGSVLRAARELLAVLPIAGVLVHADADVLDTGTGHHVRETIVSAYCPREALERVKWDAVDASDLIERLLHRMKMRKSKGFAPVERLEMPTATRDITAG